MCHLLLYELWKGRRETGEYIQGTIKVGSRLAGMNEWKRFRYVDIEGREPVKIGKNRKKNTTHTKEKE